MTVLWLLPPIISVVIASVLLLRVDEFELAVRRERALRLLEVRSGSRIPDDEDRLAGWFVSPDHGRYPRRVRLFRYAQPAGKFRFEEPDAEGTCAGGSP